MSSCSVSFTLVSLAFACVLYIYVTANSGSVRRTRLDRSKIHTTFKGTINIASIPDEKLYDFLTTFHARLPRELRDMTYAHFLDGSTVTILQYYNTQKLYKLRGGYDNCRCGLSSGPRFLDKSLVPSCVSREVIQTFYETSRGLLIDMEGPHNLMYELSRDIFDCGVKIADIPLRALHLLYPLDYSLPFRIGKKQLATDLAPLVRPTFRKKKGFRLTITMAMKHGSMKNHSKLVAQYTEVIASLFANVDVAVMLFLAIDVPNQPYLSDPTVDLTGYLSLTYLTRPDVHQIHEKLKEYKRRIQPYVQHEGVVKASSSCWLSKRDEALLSSVKRLRVLTLQAHKMLFATRDLPSLAYTV